MLALLWCGPLLAQTPTVEGLRAVDWRERNATAAALAAAPTLDVTALVQVLQQPWDGVLPEVGRYGGRFGGSKPVDPRQRILGNETEAARRGAPEDTLHPYARFRPETARDLLIPHHPHGLATWLLSSRPDAAPAIAAAVQQVGITTFDLATVWLANHPHPLAEMLPLLQQKATAAPLALALFHRGEPERDLLRAALAEPLPAVHAVVLALGEPTLLDRAAGLAAAVEQLLTNPNEATRQRAAWVLAQRPNAAAAAIAPRLLDATTVRRAAGFLCQIGAAAQAAGAALLPFTDIDYSPTRHRILVALGSFDLPPASRPAAAQRLFALAVGDFDADTRLLAIDALGRQAEGVDATMREQLAAMLAKPPCRGADARALGCLQQLGAVPPLDQATKARLAASPLATTATWLALADEGAAGAALLEPLLEDPRPGRDLDTIVRRLAVTAPETLTRWLAADREYLRQIACYGLQSLGAASPVPTERIVQLLGSNAATNAAALRWLATRPDAARYLPQIAEVLVAQPTSWAVPAGAELVASLQIPPEVKFTSLEPLLREGHAWAAVRNLPAAMQREACRRWLEEAEADTTRDRLLAELARLGLAGDDEVAFAVAALGTRDCGLLVGALQTAPSLPEGVRAALADVIDRFLPAQGFGNVTGLAVEALWAHRHR